MAQANVLPVMDPMAGAAAFAEDLPRVLKVLGATSLEAIGWRQPDKLTLLVPLKGVKNGATDEYLLRLGFQAYRSWPPSAQFVDPQTLSYRGPQDQHVMPQLASGECRTHPGYPSPSRGPIQLICCSATLEFYEVLHSVEPEHVWRDTDKFLTTINAIKRAMSEFYEGRYPAHG
jgi:hypothetical protein